MFFLTLADKRAKVSDNFSSVAAKLHSAFLKQLYSGLYQMEIPNSPVANQFNQHFGFKESAGIYNSTNLTFQTREGDLVTLYSDNEFSYSGSAKKTRFEDGVTLEEISVEARAASQYSISVQGDLNEEELLAIKELTLKISPVVKGFFEQSNFDLGQVVQSFQDSAGVINSLELNLEQRIYASVSIHNYNETGRLEEEGKKINNFIEDLSSVRDLPSLVKSVVESSIKQEEDFSPGNNYFQSLVKLSELLQSRLIQLLNRNSNIPATEPFLE